MSERLCYVEGCWAYFTTQALDKQWGDDWNDAPYEHNAGTPYSPCWHNEPRHLNDPYRGLSTPGELCRKSCCINDWDDAGNPMWTITKVAWESPLEPPCEGEVNSRWSVQAINRGEVAWLGNSQWSAIRYEPIFAGVSIAEFTRLIEASGGRVFLENPPAPNHPTSPVPSRGGGSTTEGSATKDSGTTDEVEE